MQINFPFSCNPPPLPSPRLNRNWGFSDIMSLRRIDKIGGRIFMVMKMYDKLGRLIISQVELSEGESFQGSFLKAFVESRTPP